MPLLNQFDLLKLEHIYDYKFEKTVMIIEKDTNKHRYRKTSVSSKFKDIGKKKEREFFLRLTHQKDAAT